MFLFVLFSFFILMSIRKVALLSAGALVLGATAVNQSFAFTGGTGGFPVSESSDITTVTSGATNAGMGFLNFIISMWQPILVIIVVGAVVSFVKGLRGSTKWAVHGR